MKLEHHFRRGRPTSGQRPLIAFTSAANDGGGSRGRFLHTGKRSRDSVASLVPVHAGCRIYADHDTLTSYEDRIRFVTEPDQRQSDALNKGLKMVSGEIVGWLNSDDVYKPQALQCVLEKFGNSRTQWVYGKVDVINENGVEIRKWISWLKNRRLARLTFNQLLRANWISQMGVFWRREFLTSVGGVEQNYHLAMDYDLWLRFWKKTPGVFLDQTIASFRIYGASKSGSQYLMQLIEALHIARTHAAGHHQLDLACHRLNSCVVSFIYTTLHLIR